MSAHNPTAIYAAYGQELAELLEHALAGDLNQTAVERQVVRMLGALARLHQRHHVDDRGRCLICHSARRAWWWPWPRRSTCTVYIALRFYLRQPDKAVLAAITSVTGAASGSP